MCPPATPTSSAMSGCARTRSAASQSGFRLGLALLERRGLAAWARAWQGGRLPRASRNDAERVGGRAAHRQRASSSGALASMALALVAPGEQR